MNKIQVPFIDLKRYESGFQDALNAKFSAMTANAQFVGGEEVSRLEARLKESLGVGFAVSCANGTDALQLALRALGVGRGDTVLVPNVTFWATFEAVFTRSSADTTACSATRATPPPTRTGTSGGSCGPASR